MLIIDFSKSKQDILNNLFLNKDKWAEEIYLFLEEWWSENNVITVNTSGSTGEPKEIELQKDRVVNSAKMTGEFFDLKKNSNALLCMSPKYIAGKLMIVRSIVWKMNLICIEPTSTPMNSIGSSVHIDFAAMVPLQFKNSISELNKERIRKLLVGGGTIDRSLEDNIRNVSTEVYSSYGMTETITHIAIKKLNGDKVDENYIALEGVDINVDSRNCLVINANKIAKEEVVTNDIVELLDSKRFNWIGRYDSIINSGGIKITPENIEKILYEFISSPFYITSKEDEVLGEKIVLVLEGNEENIDLNLLKSKLPKYHVPREVIYMSKFDRTDTGKILRKKIK